MLKPSFDALCGPQTTADASIARTSSRRSGPTPPGSNRPSSKSCATPSKPPSPAATCRSPCAPRTKPPGTVRRAAAAVGLAHRHRQRPRHSRGNPRTHFPAVFLDEEKAERHRARADRRHGFHPANGRRRCAAKANPGRPASRCCSRRAREVGARHARFVEPQRFSVKRIGMIDVRGNRRRHRPSRGFELPLAGDRAAGALVERGEAGASVRPAPKRRAPAHPRCTQSMTVPCCPAARAASG